MPVRDDPIDATMPLEPEEHAAQLEGLSALIAGGDRVIDVGAGLGRIAIPLAERGCDVLAIDTEESWLVGVEQATSDLPNPVLTRQADVLDITTDLAHPRGRAHAVLILGNTLALFHDPIACAELFARLRGVMTPDGVLLVDHLHSVVWREVREGYWQEGVSEDGDLQMVWSPGDAVIAFRQGPDVDTARETVDDRDAPMRLWSWGALRLLARASGFSDPEAMLDRHLVAFRAV